jgi:hypothetical protein
VTPAVFCKNSGNPLVAGKTAARIRRPEFILYIRNIRLL